MKKLRMKKKIFILFIQKFKFPLQIGTYMFIFAVFKLKFYNCKCECHSFKYSFHHSTVLCKAQNIKSKNEIK